MDTRGVFQSESERAAAGRFGLWLLLVVLGMLFGAVIVLLLVLRFDPAGWPAQLPALPWPLWASTGVLGVQAWALSRARGQGTRDVAGALWWGVLLAVVFTATQVWAWEIWHEAMDGAPVRRLALAAMYVVIGVHLAHVLGGLVPLVQMARAYGQPMNEAAALRRRTQLDLLVRYWHFIDVAWVVMLATLLVVV